MRRFVPVSALALMAMAMAAPAALGQAAPPGMVLPIEAADPVVATVNGDPVRRSDLVSAQRNLPEQFQNLPIEVLFPVMIERLIDAKMISQAGRKQGLQDDADVKRRIAQYEDRVIQEIYLTRAITDEMTEPKLRERYAEFVKANPPREEVRASHILVRTETEGKTVIADLKKGGDFAKLAADKSIDPSGKAQGGDLGYFSREEMVKEFSDAAFTLKDGETTEVPVKSQFGWHVIRRVAARSGAPAFEEVREQLINQATQETVAKVVEQLRADAKVERFNLDGSPVDPNAPKPAR